jgi:polysaccharide export outer membrane protein
MQASRVVALLLIVIAAAGCARRPQYMSYAPTYSAAYAPPVAYQAPFVQAATAAPAYLLDAGDRLRITVFGQEGLTNSYAVDASGNISMPLIGTIPARGRSADALAQAITARLKQGFIRDPSVSVQIEAYRPFFILGEVTTPGQYPYVANMTVETAVAIAGGFGPRADKSRVTISRNIMGQSAQFVAPLNYPVQPGDTVRIRERWF